MAFRVTSFALENQAIRFAARHSADVFKYQQQITSGVRIQRPSDDPVAFREISSLNSRFSELTVELSTVRSTETVLNNSVSQLQEANRVITSAITALQQGIQATDETDRTALALEIDGVLDQLKTIANSSFNGNFLYSGTKTNQRPFEFSVPLADGRSTSTLYGGSQRASSVAIGTSLSIDNFYVGQELFGRGARNATVFYGETGAAPGTGTDTLTSRASLEVSHDLTSYTGSSGIAAGVSSAEFDTVIGQHQLQINDVSGNGTSGTISLNGGEEVAFSAGDTDLLIPGPKGEQVFVNASAIAAGFVGSVTIQSSGFLSVDGGLTTTPIDFSSNQIVPDSLTQGFTTVNSESIHQTGSELLEFQGTSDPFQVLYNIASDFRNENSRPESEVRESLDRHFVDLENARDKILEFIGEQSASLRTLENIGFQNESLQLQVQTQSSSLQATDISEAALRFSNAEALLQYTYSVTAQITSTGILDFLR